MTVTRVFAIIMGISPVEPYSSSSFTSSVRYVLFENFSLITEFSLVRTNRKKLVTISLRTVDFSTSVFSHWPPMTTDEM